MSPHADTNWWDFEIETAIRSDVDAARIKGQHEVNPLQDDRRLLEYHKYLGLDQLLECQTPASKIPDERVFIITHQLFELVFKLMIFDLAVIAKTFETLLEVKESSEFQQLCLASGQEHEDFWRPALTASERTKFNSGTILTDFMKYLGKAEDETFSSIEFYYFRDNLIPASGFQTAQFRLIQRALGKNNLLSVRLFPSDTFRKHYGDSGDDPARVTDKIILRSGVGIATPQIDSPMAMVAKLDDLAHQVLARIPEHPLIPSPIEQIDPNAIELACKSLETLLQHKRAENHSTLEPLTPEAGLARDKQALDEFRNDLTEAVENETTRRAGLDRSRLGAFYLHKKAGDGHLARVLDRLRISDDSLFGYQNPNSFLKIHMDVARARINEAKAHALSIGKPEPPSGTGGGGIDYLAYSRRRLIPLFPALVGYRGL